MAALIVPKIISERTNIETKPAPILLGDHSIIILDGIKKIKERIRRSGNIDNHEFIFGNGPKADENNRDVNNVTIKP